MKFILTLVAAATAFVFGACSSCPHSHAKGSACCDSGKKGDACCVEKPAKKK